MARFPVYIDSARAYALRMPLKVPWKTSFGAQPDITTVLVRLDGRGATGWGEAAPGTWPLFCGEWGDATFALLRDYLLPRVIGVDIADHDALTGRFAEIRGNLFARAAIETAWWALLGAIEQRPLGWYAGASRASVRAGADFDIHADTGELLAKIAAALDSGCPRVKLKVGPRSDIGQLREVRRSFPDAVLHIDCNGGFTPDDVDRLAEFDEFGFAMIEQPLGVDDFLGHARLQRRLETAVCLDESIRSMHDLELAVELGCCRMVSVKPGRVGGFANAAAIGRAAQRAGLGAVVGNMLESPVGAQICLALAACDWATYPADLFPAERFFSETLTVEDIRQCPEDDWTFEVPNTPGNPAVPRDEPMSRWLVADSGRVTT